MTILSVGAHMDDSEYGIGGILIQAVRDGHRVVCVVATGDYTSWGNTVGREEACKKQQAELAEKFGYEKRWLNYKYHQVEADVAFKKQISKIYVEVKPDITFVHDTSDTGRITWRVGSGRRMRCCSLTGCRAICRRNAVRACLPII